MGQEGTVLGIFFKKCFKPNILKIKQTITNIIYQVWSTYYESHAFFERLIYLMKRDIKSIQLIHC